MHTSVLRSEPIYPSNLDGSPWLGQRGALKVFWKGFGSAMMSGGFFLFDLIFQIVLAKTAKTCFGLGIRHWFWHQKCFQARHEACVLEGEADTRCLGPKDSGPALLAKKQAPPRWGTLRPWAPCAPRTPVPCVRPSFGTSWVHNSTLVALAA